MRVGIPFYKPVKQREEAFGRSDELNDILQNASWQLGGAPAVVAVEAPAALDAHLQGVSNSTQLFCQTSQALSSHAVSLETNIHKHAWLRMGSTFHPLLSPNPSEEGSDGF